MAETLPTHADLQAMRERCADATPGPWSCWNAWDIVPDHVAVERIGPEDSQMGLVASTSFGGDIHCSAADAQFVAHARADLPRLLAALEQSLEVIAHVAALPISGKGHPHQEWPSPSVQGSSYEWVLVSVEMVTAARALLARLGEQQP